MTFYSFLSPFVIVFGLLMVLIGAYVLLSHVEDTSAVVPPIGGAHTIADSINKGILQGSDSF